MYIYIHTFLMIQDDSVRGIICPEVIEVLRFAQHSDNLQSLVVSACGFLVR